MNFKNYYFILFLLVLLLSVSCASANEIEDNITAVSDESPIEIVKDTGYLDIGTFEESDVLQYSSQDSILNSEEEGIVVNNWDELQYYCAQTDKDYTLKLKENTNFYPTNPSDSNYQIKVNNNVKIIGSEGSYIGDDSSSPSRITYTAI